MQFDRPEDELMVLLARFVIEPEQKRRVNEIIAQEINWSYFFDRVTYHGVHALVYKNLLDFKVSGLAEAVSRQLKADHFVNMSRNMALTAELVSILRALQAENVPVVALKGPVLAQMLYGDIALRSYVDLDILIPPDQLEQAKAILLGKGYQYTDTQVRRSERNEEHLEHHYNLVKNDQLSLELHWTLEPTYFSQSEDTELFWKSIKPISCFGMTIFVPADEEMLLYLCRHGSRHLWKSLKWLCDVAQYINVYPNLDWQLILARAEQTHTKRLVFLAFNLAMQVFGTTIPPEIVREIEKDRKVQRFTAQILESMFAAPESVERDENYAIDQIRLIQLQEQPSQFLKYTFGLLRRRARPNDDDRSLVDLPPHLAFLYYVVRPVRLLGTYGVALAKRIIT